MDARNRPSISIITVCFNAEKEIAKTIESVLNQKSCDYEYIIIDGKSQDSTISIVDKYKEKFINKGIKYKVISEKDKGIYDAMNKGIGIADGIWLNFLNAGDYFVNSNVLNDVIPSLRNVSDGVVYGDYIDRIWDLEKKIKAKPIDKIIDGMIFSHQSAFINSKIMKKRNYDISYKIAGDYDFFLELYCSGIQFNYLGFPVAVFIRGGISSIGGETVLLEEAKTKLKNNIIGKEKYEDIIDEINNPSTIRKFITMIKRYIPSLIYDYYIYKKFEYNGYIKHVESDYKDVGRKQ